MEKLNRAHLRSRMPRGLCSILARKRKEKSGQHSPHLIGEVIPRPIIGPNPLKYLISWMQYPCSNKTFLNRHLQPYNIMLINLGKGGRTKEDQILIILRIRVLLRREIRSSSLQSQWHIRSYCLSFLVTLWSQYVLWSPYNRLIRSFMTPMLNVITMVGQLDIELKIVDISSSKCRH